MVTTVISLFRLRSTRAGLRMCRGASVTASLLVGLTLLGASVTGAAPQQAAQPRSTPLEELHNRYDAVVIGAGLSGMVAAGLLGKVLGKQASVLLIEKAAGPGGFAASFVSAVFEGDARVGWATHNIGTLTNDYTQSAASGQADLPIYELLQALGIDINRGGQATSAGTQRRPTVEMMPLRDVIEARFKNPDGSMSTYRIPASQTALRRYLEREFPRHKGEIAALLRASRRLARQAVGAHATPNPLQLGAYPLHSHELFKQHAKTYDAFLDDHLEASADGAGGAKETARLKQVLGSLWPFLGLDSQRASAVYYAVMLNTFANGGAATIKGGTQNLSDALAEACRANGVDMVYRAAADKIHVKNGQVSGLTFKKGRRGVRRTVDTSVVVSSATLRRTITELVGEDHFPPRIIEQVNRAQVAASGFAVGAAIKGPASGEALDLFGKAAYSIYYPSADTAQHMYRLQRAGGLVARSSSGKVVLGDWGTTVAKLPLVVGLSTVGDSSLAPKGWHVLEALVPGDPFASDLGRQLYAEKGRKTYKQLKLDAAQTVLKHVAAVYPELRPLLRNVDPRNIDAHTTLTAARFNAPDWYGTACLPEQTGFARSLGRFKITETALVQHLSERFPSLRAPIVQSSLLQTAFPRKLPVKGLILTGEYLGRLGMVCALVRGGVSASQAVIRHFPQHADKLPLDPHRIAALRHRSRHR